MSNSSSTPKRYAPRGDSQYVRVAFSLDPQERAEAEDLAEAAGITRGALLREVYLLGIPLYRAQHPANTPNEA
ncbi:hypothetical protein [Luteibacter mycovicinus]|uniref:hypothetical protein n=1 Tax=Luteibacter mycovicinus TaxID=1500890 RepID=UPI00056827FF|nr:hypothetical protein [Luteibacter sp. 9143a]